MKQCCRLEKNSAGAKKKSGPSFKNRVLRPHFQPVGNTGGGGGGSDFVSFWIPPVTHVILTQKTKDSQFFFCLRPTVYPNFLISPSSTVLYFVPSSGEPSWELGDFPDAPHPLPHWDSSTVLKMYIKGWNKTTGDFQKPNWKRKVLNFLHIFYYESNFRKSLPKMLDLHNIGTHNIRMVPPDQRQRHQRDRHLGL